MNISHSLILFVMAGAAILPAVGLYAEQPSGAILADHAFFWRPFQDLLDRYLSRTTVEGVELAVLDYAGVKGDPAFAEMAGRLEKFSLLTLASKRDALAFWINAYNFLAIKLVVEHYPVESIKDIGSLFSSVWNRPAGTVGGKEYTLDEIEHRILRKEFAEPRIHFAIVCASLSCPDLRKEVYLPEKLDAQLDDSTSKFVHNPTKGLRIEGKKIYISRLFSWFADDFQPGGVWSFLQKYRPELGEEKDYSVGYLDYNWDLNEK